MSSTIDELVAQINSEYEKNKEPDKNTLVAQIYQIFGQLKPTENKHYYVNRNNIDIHKEIKRLDINFKPNIEKELVIAFDKEGGYMGIDMQFLTYEALVALKQKIPEILQFIIDFTKYDYIYKHDLDIKSKLSRCIELSPIKSLNNEITMSIVYALYDMDVIGPNDELFKNYRNEMSELVKMGNKWLEQNKDKNSEDIQKIIDETRMKRWGTVYLK